MIRNTLMAGLAVGFLSIMFAQGAHADTTYTFRSWTSSPDTTFVETPSVERVVTSPVVIERPMTIERPMNIERPLILEQKSSHHLLNLKLF